MRTIGSAGKGPTVPVSVPFRSDFSVAGNRPESTLKDWSCHAGPMVRILLPPAVSQVRTYLSREFAFLGREAAVFRGVQAGTSGAVGRDTQGAATSG
jgi:hypothetical protein